MRRLISILALLLALASCKTRVVPIDIHHYHRDSLVTVQRDTIYTRDSVIIKQLGDTIYIRETSDRIRSSVETTQAHKVDSVPPPSVSTLKRIIEEYPPQQKGSNILLLLALGAAIHIVLYVVYRFAKTKR